MKILGVEIVKAGTVAELQRQIDSLTTMLTQAKAAPKEPKEVVQVDYSSLQRVQVLAVAKSSYHPGPPGYIGFALDLETARKHGRRFNDTWRYYDPAKNVWLSQTLETVVRPLQ